MPEEKTLMEKLELTRKQKYYIQIAAIAAGVIASALQASRFILDHKENNLQDEIMRKRR